MNLADDQQAQDVKYPEPEILGILPKDNVKQLPLVYWPNPILNKSCENIDTFDYELEQFIYDLTFTMMQQSGVGIAAPQVGKNINLIVVEEQLDISNPVVLINPVILKMDDYHSFEASEGCLSVPGYFETRSRPNSVLIEYLNATGQTNIKNFVGFGAFVVQHEIEHLIGQVFVDGLSKLKLKRILKKTKKHRKLRG